MVRDADAVLKLVAYERVSPTRQVGSGLGLEAQRTAIDAFASKRQAQVRARCTEVEADRKNKRPELDAALYVVRLNGATLVIAKLDRLSRNAAFLLTLRGVGVSFLGFDMPVAKDFTVGIMALVARQEREAISRSRKEALAAAKARSVKLGNPNGTAALRCCDDNGQSLRSMVAANAKLFAEMLELGRAVPDHGETS